MKEKKGSIRTYFNILSNSLLLILLSLSVTFEASAENADGTPDFNACIYLEKTGVESAVPGDEINYTFEIYNCGDITLAEGVYLYDPMFGDGVIWTGDLDPEESHTFSKSYTVTSDDCGNLVNNAWAIGYPVGYGGQYPVRHDSQWDVYVICEPPPGTGTPGYWKNHRNAWPVDSIMIGGTNYSVKEAISNLKKPEKGDKLRTMFRALVAAKLNVLVGNEDSCIADTIEAADNWMTTNGPIGSDNKVHADSVAWSVGEPLAWLLDTYNNGNLCALPRD